MKTNIDKERIGRILLIVLSIISIIAICLIPPITQSQEYHNFSDTYELLSVSNFWNVISNIPFVIVGAWGLCRLKQISEKRIQYFVLFTGVIFIGIGSGYYHLNPTDATLVWDRLPMTIVFMSLVSIIISEFIKPKLGRTLLVPLILVGLLSVIYWVVKNDLRPYVLVQFYPMLAIPVILLCFKSRYKMSYSYWLLLLAYIIAKACEHFDEEVFNFLSIISGHSLKHIASAIGLGFLLYTYVQRSKYLTQRYNE